MSKVITFDSLEMQSKNSKRVNILPYSIEKNKEHLFFQVGQFTGKYFFH